MSVEKMNKLLSKLSNYSKSTQEKFLNQIEQQGISPTDALEFVNNTEKYNANIKRAYTKKKNELIKEWDESVVPSQTRQWVNLMYDDRGNLTKLGMQQREMFIDSRISDLIPTQPKSIILSESSLKEGYKEVYERRVKMAEKGYISKRMDTYIDNYRASIRKTKENPQPYIDAYNKLTRAQKIALADTSIGKIRYNYTTKGGDDYADFIDVLKEIAPETDFDT